MDGVNIRLVTSSATCSGHFHAPLFDRSTTSRFTRRASRPTLPLVSKKSAKIAALIEDCRGQQLDAHYLGYFACFNRGLFYEAHDVLEELWLADRQGPDGDFFKGLIQFAGAFVHLQKHTGLRPRLHPSAALFKLARTNLARYPAFQYQLDVTGVLAIIEEWLAHLEAGGFTVNPLADHPTPVVNPLRQEAGAQTQSPLG